MSGECDFHDKKALVTGRSRGIGRAVCIELVCRGADVDFIYRNRDAEEEATAAKIRALGRRVLALKAGAPAVGERWIMPLIRRLGRGTAIDPNRSSAGQFCCDAQRCPLVDFVLDGQFA
jgi:NAD(P)-dependent dehydrogenase (short-subunit alcohol dehydrogenase family)